MPTRLRCKPGKNLVVLVQKSHICGDMSGRYGPPIICYSINQVEVASIRCDSSRVSRGACTPMAGMYDDLKNVTEWLLVHARRKFCDALAIVPEKHRDAPASRKYRYRQNQRLYRMKIYSASHLKGDLLPSEAQQAG